MKKLKLVLENGKTFVGESVGADLQDIYVLGEVVFNTSMTGYQEILSDPSYCDQMIVMTYPLIGNYGFNRDDFESLTPHLRALIVSELSQTPSHYRSEGELSELLLRYNIPAMSGVDTRELTKIIRTKGSMKAALVPEDYSQHNVQLLLQQKLPENQIQKVSTKQSLHYPGEKERIVLIDYGVKKNILRSILKRGCDVVVVPFNASVEEIMRWRPQGIVLSNGPGDPTSVPETLPVIKKLTQALPVFGICMGHQLLSLAYGAKTEKLKFGHRGANHPVTDLKSGKILMTSQNHSYAVVKESIQNTELEISQINLNDQTVEGLTHKTLPVFSVQYHPEAFPGPEDSNFLFDQFLEMVRKHHYAKI